MPAQAQDRNGRESREHGPKTTSPTHRCRMQVQWQTSVPHAAHRTHAISAFFWSHICAHLELHMRNPFRENGRFSPALAARAHAATSEPWPQSLPGRGQQHKKSMTSTQAAPARRMPVKCTGAPHHKQYFLPISHSLESGPTYFAVAARIDGSSSALLRP